jgi:hypothetical protein
MKRQILAGLAVAGALTVWVGSSAFANQDPAETLLQRAEAIAATASDQVSTCAEAKITQLETTTKPTGVDADAWEQAVETANETVLSKAEAAQAAIQAKLETFAEAVEAAEEDNATLPTEADLTTLQTDVTAIATAACTEINAVTIVTPTTTPADTENDNSTVETGDKTESKTSDKSSD